MYRHNNTHMYTCMYKHMYEKIKIHITTEVKKSQISRSVVSKSEKPIISPKAWQPEELIL